MRYLFECKCGNEWPEYRTINERDNLATCPECEGEGVRIITPILLKADLMSDQWVKNRNQVMKREQKCLKEHGTYR